jgi:hypothetical protein
MDRKKIVKRFAEQCQEARLADQRANEVSRTDGRAAGLRWAEEKATFAELKKLIGSGEFHLPAEEFEFADKLYHLVNDDLRLTRYGWWRDAIVDGNCFDAASNAFVEGFIDGAVGVYDDVFCDVHNAANKLSRDQGQIVAGKVSAA